MGQNPTTEEVLKIEAETLTLKREYKHALENVERVKADTLEIIATKDRITKELEQRTVELVRILNQISDEKLHWAIERQREIDEITLKKSEADNVLKRKSELNEQEEKIRQLEANEIAARNEARQLEFKNEQAKVDFENREKQIKVLQKIVEDDKEKIHKDKENFKANIIKVIKTIDRL